MDVRSSQSSLASSPHVPANHVASRVMNPPSATAGVVRPAITGYVCTPSRMLTRSQARRERERRVGAAIGALLYSAPPSPNQLPSSPPPPPTSSTPSPTTPPPQHGQQQQPKSKIARRKSDNGKKANVGKVAKISKQQPATTSPNATTTKKSQNAKKSDVPAAANSQKAGNDTNGSKKKKPASSIKKTKQSATPVRAKTTTVPYFVPPPATSFQMPPPPHSGVTTRSRAAKKMPDVTVVLPKSGSILDERRKDGKSSAGNNKRRRYDAVAVVDQTKDQNQAEATQVPVSPSPPRQKSVAARRKKSGLMTQVPQNTATEKNKLDEEKLSDEKAAQSTKRRRSDPVPEPVHTDSSDIGSTQEGDAENLVEIARNLPIPDDREPVAVQKKVSFHRNVKTRWMDRVMGQNGPAPYYLTGEAQFESVQRLKRPQKQKHPQKISTDEMIAIGDVTDFEALPIMENPKQRRGCSDTCGSSEGGCGASCSCRLDGLECSDYFECPCHPQCCDRWNAQLAEIQTDEAREREVASANEKTAAWSPRNNSTLSSVGTFESDLQVFACHNLSEEMSGTFENSEDAEESVIPMEEELPEPQVQPEQYDVQFQEVTVDAMEIGNLVEEEEMNEEENAVDIVEEEEEEKEEEDTMQEDGSNSSSDDEIDYTKNLPIDLKPENFPQQMLNMMAQMVGKDEEETCRPRNWLGADAVFMGLLKVATQHNRDSHIHGRHAAVLHPQVFFEAHRLATDEAAEVSRRKMAKIRGPAPLRNLDEDIITQLAVYGSGWTEMFIPINVDNRHWVMAIVQRSTVEVVVYDSQETNFTPKSSREVLMMEQKKKEHQEVLKMRKAALRKILEALEKLNSPDDTTTGRFRIRFARALHTNMQSDGHSCGIFALVHARRSLQCPNSNLRLKKGEAALNILRERSILREDIKKIREALEAMQAGNIRLVHDGNGMKRCTPGKAMIKLRWAGRI